MEDIKNPVWLYIGIKGEDANTNEILYAALDGAGISNVCEWKLYKKKPVGVWKVPSHFIKAFYRKQHNFMLLFDVYIELNATMQLFDLLKFVVRKEAKHAKFPVYKKIKKRMESR